MCRIPENNSAAFPLLILQRLHSLPRPDASAAYSPRASGSDCCGELPCG